MKFSASEPRNNFNCFFFVRSMLTVYLTSATAGNGHKKASHNSYVEIGGPCCQTTELKIIKKNDAEYRLISYFTFFLWYNANVQRKNTCGKKTKTKGVFPLKGLFPFCRKMLPISLLNVQSLPSKGRERKQVKHIQKYFVVSF